MTIGTMDIFLLVIIVAALMVGFFWGAARSLMMLAAWLLAFLMGAYLKLELGSYLAREWPEFAASFSEMAAFGVIYMGILLGSPFLILVSTRGSQNLTTFALLDDLVGAAFAGSVAVLGIAGLMIVMSTFYGVDPDIVDAGGGPEWTATLYQSLVDSNIGRGIAEQLVPLLGNVFGPILPPDVREVMI
jgi:hypothetical protein